MEDALKRLAGENKQFRAAGDLILPQVDGLEDDNLGDDVNVDSQLRDAISAAPADWMLGSAAADDAENEQHDVIRHNSDDVASSDRQFGDVMSESDNGARGEASVDSDSLARDPPQGDDVDDVNNSDVMDSNERESLVSNQNGADEAGSENGAMYEYDNRNINNFDNCEFESLTRSLRVPMTCPSSRSLSLSQIFTRMTITKTRPWHASARKRRTSITSQLTTTTTHIQSLWTTKASTDQPAPRLINIMTS